MNIQIIRDNLKNTISGKEKYLAEMKENYQLSTMAEGMALTATIEFLEINLTELKRILEDVEQCAKQASDDSWITNPDRMGGGGWTAEELDPIRGWK